MSSGYPPNPPPHDGGHSNEANSYRESHHQYQNLAQAQPQQTQQQTQPAPVRTINRTKTVKNNLGQAGNKMRGLFGKKQKDSDNGHNKVAGPREEPRSFSPGNSQRGWDRASIPSSFQEDPLDRPISQAMSYYGERSGGPVDNNNGKVIHTYLVLFSYHAKKKAYYYHYYYYYFGGGDRVGEKGRRRRVKGAKERKKVI